MIRPRSQRDRERLDYEGRKAVAMLRLEAIRLTIAGEHDRAKARRKMARDLQRALNGQKTGFDIAGGRNEWLQQQEGVAANG